MVELSAAVSELSRVLQPKEQFQVPAAFLGVFRGDWDEAGYRTHRFAEAAVARQLPDQGFPYVMWDSWKYQTHIDENTLRNNAQHAARLGVEVFVVDLGWARQIGDWHEAPEKFPSGLRALSDYVHALGMKFGLHLPLAEASMKAPVLISNPDWRSSESYGYFDAESLCLSHRPVREWIVREVIRIIDDYQVDWILQDGENMVKKCVKTTHSHAPFDSNYSNSVDGLNAVVGALLAQRPAVHWENCEDGGAMMTYNMVRNYVTSIAADDSGPMTTRQAVYGITYPFPPRYADRYMPDEELGHYITRSFMFGGPWILMNRLPSMREEDLELLAREIALFKTFRTRIRDGKVLHLTARPAENRIDAIASYHLETDTAIAFVFRAEAPAASYRVRLSTLKPEATYRIRFQEDWRLLTMTGRQISDAGIRVNLPGMWTCDIVYVEPLSN
jgi:alpha-galactosidase